jgi:hypothetical protein
VVQNKEAAMVEKRKRAPGGGRKAGPLGKLGEVISLRLPEKLKAKLQQAADQSGRTLNWEAISRLDESFGGSERSDFTYQLVRRLTAMSMEIDFMLAAAKHGWGLKSKGKR